MQWVREAAQALKQATKMAVRVLLGSDFGLRLPAFPRLWSARARALPRRSTARGGSSRRGGDGGCRGRCRESSTPPVANGDELRIGVNWDPRMPHVRRRRHPNGP
jgi:hypothetical protein